MEKLIKAKVEPGRVAIHWLGQSGFALKAHAGDVIVIDPFLSDSAARLAPVPVKPKDVVLDFLFLTHDHGDHTDPHSAPVIAQQNPGAVVVCPPSAALHLAKLGVGAAQIKTVMPGQALEFPHFTAHVVAAQHTDDSVGYVFEFNEVGPEPNGPVVYLTGDTEYSDSLAAAVADFAPDVLIVPITGPRNLDAAHAAKLTGEIGPREVIPCHYGMFEQINTDPNVFVSLLAAADAEITPVVMAHNACHLYSAEGAVQGRQAHKKARAARAETARQGREHHDGVRGPNGGSGVSRGGGRGR